MANAEEPRWLNETQQEAWRGLVAITSRAFPEVERRLRAQEMLAVHYQIFVELSEAPNRTRRLKELADRANLSQSRLTHRLRLLVERGDITISDDVDDRRAKNATLTPAGRQRLEHIAPGHANDVQCLIFDPLTPKQTSALADAVSAISAHLCQHPEFLNPPNSQ